MQAFKRLAFALTAAAALLTAPLASAQTIFKSADTHPDGYPTVEAVKYMGELLKERSGGRYGIEVFFAAQLGEERDTIEQVQYGVIEMNRISLGPFNNIIPETKAPSLPFIFRSTEHRDKVMQGPIGEELLKAFEAHGLVGLAFYESGARSFYNRVRPINSIEDMKGLKIRVIQSDVFLDMMEALGANATPMPYGEVYSSIQTGVIDGAENNWPSYESSGHYEVAPHFSLDEHLMVPEVLVMSKVVWDKLSAEDQALIRQAAKDSVARMSELWAAREAESEARVRAAGAQIVTEIDKAPFIAAMKPVYDKHVDTPALRDLVERIQATE